MAELRRLFNVSCHPLRNDCETVIPVANLAVSYRLLWQPANIPMFYRDESGFSFSMCVPGCTARSAWRVSHGRKGIQKSELANPVTFCRGGLRGCSHLIAETSYGGYISHRRCCDGECGDVLCRAFFNALAITIKAGFLQKENEVNQDQEQLRSLLLEKFSSFQPSAFALAFPGKKYTRAKFGFQKPHSSQSSSVCVNPVKPCRCGANRGRKTVDRRRGGEIAGDDRKRRR